MASCAHGRQALADVAVAGRGLRVYEKHDPFAQALHQVVRENLATFYAAIEEGWESRLPEFVRDEFAGYLDCSVMQRGFAHLACEDCGVSRLVAFTCAGRGFCPTCLGRRMNQTTHNLLAHVVPAQPLRQWVLSLPFALRAPLAYETGLMSVVARIFEDSLLRLTFGLTVDECAACGGRMKLRALVRDPESIERFLRQRGMWASPIDQASARAPPFHRCVTRLAPTRQQELFPET